jgi:hypothetical protein
MSNSHLPHLRRPPRLRLQLVRRALVPAHRSVLPHRVWVHRLAIRPSSLAHSARRQHMARPALVDRRRRGATRRTVTRRMDTRTDLEVLRYGYLG